MNKQATIVVHGSAGPGAAENMMSGKVVVKGDVSQYAGATGRGGMLALRIEHFPLRLVGAGRLLVQKLIELAERGRGEVDGSH